MWSEITATLSFRVDGAARVAAFSPGAFSRFFAQVAGRPFNRYVNEVRVSHACRLLTETEMPGHRSGVCLRLRHASRISTPGSAR